MCQLYLNGAKAFVNELENWSPKETAFSVASIVFRRLIDLGQSSLIDKIIVHHMENVWILLAAINELNGVQKFPRSKAVKAAFNGLKDFAAAIKEYRRGFSREEPTLSIMNAVVQAAIIKTVAPHSKIADVLETYVPSSKKLYVSKFSDDGQFSFLRAVCLKAALRGETVEILELAPPEIKNKIEQNSHTYDSDARAFIDLVESFLPWHQLWTRAVLGLLHRDEIDLAIEECVSKARKATHSSSRSHSFATHEISIIWLEVLLMVKPDASGIEKFIAWKGSLENNLFVPTLTWLIRLFASSDLYSDYVYAFAQEVFTVIDEVREDATPKIQTYIDISRAIYALSKDEAKYYLEAAIKVAGRTGRENLDRWSSLLDLSVAAADPNEPEPELCYRLSRAAEVVYDFVDRDKYFTWEGTTEGITKLCPSSSMAIMSRWKDRKFSSASRVFPHAINCLSDVEHVSPLTAVMLIGYSYDWPYADRIRSAVSAVKEKKEQAKLLQLITRYLLVRGLPPKQWMLISDIAKEIGWTDCKFEQTVAREKNDYEQDRSAIEHFNERHSIKRNDSKYWDLVFTDLNQPSTASIQNAYNTMQAGEPPYRFDEFVAEFYRRVNPGKEKDALEAIFNVSIFHLYHKKDHGQDHTQHQVQRDRHQRVEEDDAQRMQGQGIIHK